MFLRLTLLGCSLLAAVGGTAFAQGGEGATVADISQLVVHTGADVLPADTQAYDALDVPGMAAGTAFADPVTGVRTVKLTDADTPRGGSDGWVTFYSTLGLQISQPWGPGRDRYTIAFHSPGGDPQLVDYQLGGGTSNYRAAPEGAGQVAFARTGGNERILYVATGSRLRRYDTGEDRYADTGPFPFEWQTFNGGAAWLTLNRDETWATAVRDPGAGIATALDLRTGAVVSRQFAGLDELAIGGGDVAWVMASPQQIWRLSDDTVQDIDLPAGASPLSHSATLDGFVHYFDVHHGVGIWPAYRISEGNVRTRLPPIQGYWSDSHASGHWWDVPAGTNPQALQSHSGSPRPHDTASWQFGLIFVDTRTSGKRVLGHHYSIKPSGIPGAASVYYDSPHATISNDGKIVLFSSTMNRRVRRDVFLMEVPRTQAARPAAAQSCRPRTAAVP